MLTQTQLEVVKQHPGIGWISALRSDGIRKEERVRAHIFLCMLAYYVEWHMTIIWWRIRSARWLDRKNYLFAGSHKGVRRAALVYSLLGTCKLHGVNPTKWLTHVLAHILQTKYNDVRMLYPQNFSHS